MFGSTDRAAVMQGSYKMSTNRTRNKRIRLSFMEFIYFLRNVREIIKKSFIRKQMMSEKVYFMHTK